MNILIVEDNGFTARMLKNGLEKKMQNVGVDIAFSAEQAEIFIREKNFDIAVIDVNLPRKSGIEFAKELKKYQPEVNIILMSSYEYLIPEDLGKYLKVEFLEKPFSVEKLISRIKKIREKKGFRGMVYFSHISDIIQMYGLEQKGVMIKVKKEDKEGKIYLQNGKILHVQCGGKTDEKALKEILQWEGGNIEVTEKFPEKITMEERIEEILLRIFEKLEREKRCFSSS